MGLFTALAVGSAIGSGIQGYQKGKQADAMNKKATEQAELEYRQRAPMRRQGMQALGQIEAPIDLGTTGFNSANPFAAARGPSQSVAKLGNWDRFTTDPTQVDLALTGLRPDELQFAQDALAGTELPRNGRMRFGNTGSGKTYTNDDRAHAKKLMDRYGSEMGYTGMSADDFMTQTGIQPLGARRTTPTAPAGRARTGMTPLGGR